MLHYNSSLYRLRYLRDELHRRSRDLKDPFKAIIDELATVIGKFVEYLDKSIKKGAYASHDEMLDVDTQFGLDVVGDEAFIKQASEMDEWMSYIKRYLSIMHMKNNLQRVKRELDTIDEKQYY
jgi:hypothetical protein